MANQGNHQRPGGEWVSKPEWGKKHTCRKCDSRFYDLGRNVIACPNCGAAVASKPAPAPSRQRPAAAQAREKVKAEPPPVEKKEPPAKAKADEKDAEETPPPDAKAERTGVEGEEIKDDGEVKPGGAGEGLMEDASDLGEDEDDMSEVMEHIDDAVEDKG